MLMLALVFFSRNYMHGGWQFSMLSKRKFACCNFSKFTDYFRALEAKKICTDLSIRAQARALRFCAGYEPILTMKN